MISLIVAADEGNVIGGNNQLLWRLPDDMKHFRDLTRGHPVIMGRKTFESIGRLLPDRPNIIVSRKAGYAVPGAEVFTSLDTAIECAQASKSAEIFIIGGGEIYREALPLADCIYLTRVHARYAGDVTFPDLVAGEWKEVSRTEHPGDEVHVHPFTFLTYERVGP